MNDREWAEFEMFLDALSEADFLELKERVRRHLEVTFSPAEIERAYGGLIASC